MKWMKNSIESLTGRLFKPVRTIQPIFICGVSGAGTSLLPALLHQHYRTDAYIHESDMNPALGSSRLKIDGVRHYSNLTHYRAALPLPIDISQEEIRGGKLLVYRRAVRTPMPTNRILDKSACANLLRSKPYNATFTNARFVMIFRDPADNIEGLRRKWPDFYGQESLELLCDFWQDLHEQFLADCQDFPDKTLMIAYETLVENSLELLHKTADFCALPPRTFPLGFINAPHYDDRPNSAGKGIRHVKNGVISLRSAEEKKRQPYTLSDQEVSRIRQRLSPTYEKYLARSLGM
ncbi:MAG: sulfotransferase [Magnetococcales bacterium]|nr:sulfotransferase [Magnetococcales bacterium]